MGSSLCWLRIERYNCTCMQLVEYYDTHAHVGLSACDARMDATACVGTLYDHCPRTCLMHDRLQLSKNSQHLTTIGQLQVNVGKLIGLVVLPVMVKIALCFATISSVFMPLFRVNEYLWCSTCTVNW